MFSEGIERDQWREMAYKAKESQQFFHPQRQMLENSRSPTRMDVEHTVYYSSGP